MGVTDPDNKENLVSVGEAARLLGVSVDTLRRWADDARIPVIRTPTGHRRFRIRDIDALLDQRAAS